MSSLRSSADNYAASLGGVSAYNNTSAAALTLDLSAISALQNRGSAVTFRLYVWDSTSSTTRYSVFDNLAVEVAQ